MSRTAARKRISGKALRQQLESAGVAAAAGPTGIAQKALLSCKHVAAPASRTA
jgi:hypothetical protein